MAITKPEEHDVNRTGKRLLRDVLEPLGWVVNEVQEDYGIDCNVQVFDDKSPTGAWFHVQLKSSTTPDYSADRTFISQELSIDHARHYTLEMRNPVLVIHADVISKAISWYAPQLDRGLILELDNTRAKSITIRIPSLQQLPATAPGLLTSLDKIYLVLANRELTSASTRSFAESLKHLPDQEALRREFQEKNDTLKLQKIHDLFVERKYGEARPRAQAVVGDPDSTAETKFLAQLEMQSIDYAETWLSGKPQSKLPEVFLAHAKALQKLTASGPKHLKFYSLIARKAAELEILVQEEFGVHLALQQHFQGGGNPMMVLGLYARRSALTKLIAAKYNRCVRLARYAANYPDRWMLGQSLTAIVWPIGRYIVRLHSEGNLEAERAFADSALQICKLAAWIGKETGDSNTIVRTILAALSTVRTVNSDAYRWSDQVARSLSDPDIRTEALFRIERAVKRWRGEHVEGDYIGDTKWQIIQNMAASLGIDLSNENDSLVHSLRIAAKDDTPERVLARCEHLLVSMGAMGPTARRIQRLFNITHAGSKVVHCTLHNYHVEGKELDTAYEEFKRAHCDSCPDLKPRPEGWRYTGEVMRAIEARHYEFVARLAGTPHGLRYTDED